MRDVKVRRKLRPEFCHARNLLDALTKHTKITAFWLGICLATRPAKNITATTNLLPEHEKKVTVCTAPYDEVVLPRDGSLLTVHGADALCATRFALALTYDSSHSVTCPGLGGRVPVSQPTFSVPRTKAIVLFPLPTRSS